MLIPDNMHPRHSIYFNGAFLLKLLQDKKSIELLEMYSLIKDEIKISFSVFVLCLDWLYLIGVAELKYGRVELCS